MAKQELFRDTEQRDRKEVAALLLKLAERIETGQIVLQHGSREVPLDVGQPIDVQVTASKKDKKRGTRVTLRLSLKWWEGEGDEATLSIG
jgi:amphi-Trp domain-containing protein